MELRSLKVSLLIEKSEMTAGAKTLNEASGSVVDLFVGLEGCRMASLEGFDIRAGIDTTRVAVMHMSITMMLLY